MENSVNSNFFKVDEVELFDKVHKYVASRFKKFTNLHGTTTAEDIAQGVLTWLYQTTRKGNRRVDELGFDGEAHFWNLINCMITTTMCCEVRAKNRKIQAYSLDFDYNGDEDSNVSVLNIASSDDNIEEDVALIEMVQAVPKNIIEDVCYLGNYSNLSDLEIKELNKSGNYEDLYLLQLDYQKVVELMIYYDEPINIQEDKSKIKDPIIKILKQILFKKNKDRYVKMTLKEIETIVEDVRDYISLRKDMFGIGGEIDETIWKQYLSRGTSR